ncbi:MAG: alpha-amylase family protein [Dermatophilus congolensis]|nr:alpha-amylase family protein [Dermatophilus congolensis]
MYDEVPANCVTVAAEVLSGVSDEYRTMFDLRLQRWWPDLVSGLRDLYSPEQVAELGPRLVRLAAEAFRDRDVELHRLDMRRQLQPDWLQLPNMVGYSGYTERFAGDLPGVAEQIPYLEELGVTYLHLMPLLTPREGDNDGGYAVADYRSVRPDLGTMDDLRRLTRTLRQHGISLVLDFVVNHVAKEHEWARRARAGEATYRDYFYVYPDREMPDAYEATLPEIFPDFAPGNFTHDPDLDAWVWTTFNDFQWDVNWSNPDVLAEYADLVFYLANAGVEVLRLDAIAFIWKRLGTNCQGQPEVHSITQVLRALARIACPALAFKAEAIVGPDELVQYLGAGRFTGKVSDLAYHNSLMVQIWSMLATKNVSLTAHAMRTLPPAPSTATWITYVRCHDDIGWAVSDADAAAVGLDGFKHRSFLSDWFTGQFPGSPARGLVFQHNPVTGDRRISGTAAALTGLASAIDSGSNDAVEIALRATRLAHTIIYGWGGIPVIWSGDELACLNDPDWSDEPGHADDNRWAHRVRVTDATRELRHDPDRPAAEMFDYLAHLARVRRSLPQLHAAAPTWIGDIDDPGVLVTSKLHPTGPFVGLYNITPEWRAWPRYRLREYGLTSAVDALNGERIRTEDGVVRLAPYQARWIVNGE